MYYTPKHAFVFGGCTKRCYVRPDDCVANHEVMVALLAMHLVHNTRSYLERHGQRERERAREYKETSVVVNLKI